MRVSSRRAFDLFGPFTFQLNRPGDFISFGNGSGARLRPVPPDRFERVLARYIKGDLFDSLWVARRDGDQMGIVLSHDGHGTEISVDFLPLEAAADEALTPSRVKALAHWAMLLRV